jgi:hypothetical protein
MFILVLNLVLHLKSINLIHYVSTICISWSFPSILSMWQTIYICRQTRGHMDTCINETVLMTKLTEMTK